MRTVHLFIAATLIASAQQPVHGPVTIPLPLASADLHVSDWRMVQDADLILKTRIDDMGKPDPSNPGYKTVEFVAISILKGDLSAIGNGPHPPKVRVSFYDGGGGDEIAQNHMKALRGKEALVFLTWASESPGDGTYFCQFPEAVQPFNSSAAGAVMSEIRNQEEMAAAIRRALDEHSQPMESEVLALIERLRSPGTYQKPDLEPEPNINAPDGALTFPRPIDGLQKLGSSAIPAIVKHLDDRIQLPVKKVFIELDTRNEPGAFEGIYHTTASEMVEVLILPLEKLAHASFGGGGGSDRARIKAVLGWRLYLGHDPAFRRALTAEARP